MEISLQMYILHNFQLISRMHIHADECGHATLYKAYCISMHDIRFPENKIGMRTVTITAIWTQNFRMVLAEVGHLVFEVLQFNSKSYFQANHNIKINHFWA